MFKYLNKIIRRPLRFACNDMRRGLRSSKGQVAIILILVVAIALIFYAVSLNLSRVSQIKTLITMASNSSASQLGSQMASYGQAVAQTQLGGQRLICSKSGAFLAFITAIITIIIAIVLAIITWGGSTPASAAMVQAAIASIIGAVAATAALAIQVAIIQPSLISMWNSIIVETMNTTDRFTESGIQTGLQAAITDNVLVPDMFDAEMDGAWGFDGSGRPLDEVSRFSPYYAERLKAIRVKSTKSVDSFLDALQEFTYDDPFDLRNASPPANDEWALIDPAVACFSSECNPCCVPQTVTNPFDGSTANLRPDCCDIGGAQECGVSTTCGAQSPYGPNYPWVYDPHYENPDNNLPPADPLIVSFREQLGRDDEHPDYYKNPNNPNEVPQFMHLAGEEGYHLNDTTGFYVNPPYTPLVADNRVGIFPFFYKIADWGMDLTLLDPADPANNGEHCYWYDDNYEAQCPPLTPMPAELGLQTLSLPVDPATLIVNTNWWVDSIDDNIPSSAPAPPNPPFAVDKVKFPDPADASFAGRILAQPDECAEDILTNSDDIGFWKRGADRFCSSGDEWLYAAECPKHGPLGCSEPDGLGGSVPVDCECGEGGTDPAQFPEDVLDNIIYNGLTRFIQEAQELLSADPSVLAKEIEHWYNDAAGWIEPGTSAPPLGSNADPATECAVCNPEDGLLIKIRKAMAEMRDRLDGWRNTSYEGENCEEVWCVPPAGCPAVPAGEESTFDANGNGIRGDMEDIVACLNYNVDGSSANPDEGNDFRFDQCRQTCKETNCSALPRSLFPFPQPPLFQGFNPSAYTLPANPAWQGDIDLMLACLDNCNATDCQAMPQVQSGSSCVRYFMDNPATAFDELSACFGRQYIFVGDPSTFDQTLECGNQYFTNHPSTFDETVSCVGTQYFIDDPATTEFDGDVCIDPIFGWGPGNPWYNEIDTALARVPPIPAADAALMATCQTSCSNANCQVMPQFEDIWGTTNPWYDQVVNALLLPPPAADEALITACRDNCGDIDCQAMPQFELWRPGNTWYNEIENALGFIPPIPVADAALLQACKDTCTDTDCQAMPQYENIWGPAIIWYQEIQAALPTGIAGDDSALTDCLNNCSDTACQAMPQFATGSCGVDEKYFEENPATSFTAADCTAWGPGNTWYEDILNALVMANPSCDLHDGGNPADIMTNGWLKNVELSALEAQNQVAKFKQRRDFLNNRLTEMNDTLDILNKAIMKFDEFLDGPAAGLIADRINLDDEPSGLPYQAIYAWQDEPPAGRPEGYWHIVRVDARTPGKCDSACNASQLIGGADPPFPYVRAYGKGFLSMTLCYELTATDGVVKSRVTRYDEDRDSSVLTFPNGVPIWDFRYFHPDAGTADVTGLGNTCSGSMLPDPPGLPAGVSDIYKGAFMLNELILPGPDPVCVNNCGGDAICEAACPFVAGNEDCWDRVNDILRRGVMTETCAQYYYHGGSNPGMGFKFVKCKEFP